MKHRIAEINIDTKDGGFVSGLLRVKSRKDLHKRLNKMLNKGEIDLGFLVVKAGNIEHMEINLQWMH